MRSVLDQGLFALRVQKQRGHTCPLADARLIITSHSDQLREGQRHINYLVSNLRSLRFMLVWFPGV
eukprot:1565532-Amphidinium_carterae.1